MKQYLLAPFLAALAMFFWGFVYYGLSGIPYGALQSIDRDVGPTLNELFPTSGTYVVPDPRGEADATVALRERGPIATVHLHREGAPAMAPAMMIAGFVLEFVCCLLFAFVLGRCRVNSYGGRVGLTVLAGAIVTLWTRGGDAVWWLQDWNWHRTTMLYDLVAWFLAGLVLAALIKPVSSRAG
jgi:hypothetical protein